MSSMRRIGPLMAVATVLLLGSCSTSSFIGLSRAKYVDAELEQIKSELSVAKDIEYKLESQLEEALKSGDALRQSVAAAIDSDEALQASFDDLNAMTMELASRIDELPETTLRELMAAISAYLELRNEEGEMVPVDGSVSADAPAGESTPASPETVAE